ncbi:MAG: molybdenum ABC transporter ATP-binding protein [Acidobacteriota bacterium]
MARDTMVRDTVAHSTMTRHTVTQNTVLEIAIRLPLDRFDLELDLRIDQPVTGIFGASGAGKTSLLETLTGLRRDAAGRVRLGAEVWLDSATRRFVVPERRQIGYVPQDGLLFPHFDVRQNLLAGKRRARHDGQQPQAQLAEVAELLELEPLLGRRISTLSGGERQRVALGRALCSGPHLLLLDEPFAALDLPLRRRLLPFLRRIRAELAARRGQVPMLLVTHDPIEVQALCDDVIVLRHGRVIARGEPHQVLRDPKVFALAGEESYENVLPGRLGPHRPSTRRVRLGQADNSTQDKALIVPAGDVAEGDVLVGLPANEILIATERPRGLSARNILPARILEIHAQDARGLVTADLGGGIPPVAVEVTEATPAELGLEPGGEVFLVIKATSCRIYGGANPSSIE